MIDLKDISRIYQIGSEKVYALNKANLHIDPGEFVSIIGPSGSGKSTLMNIIGCLDVADAGQYLLDGLPIESYSENQLAKIRNQKIGFVFQQYNLIPKLTAEENVELPLIYQKVPKKERTERVKEALDKVNMYPRAKHLPTELSGGQQQRVLLSRALCATQKMLLLDEPVSGLDPKVTAEMYALIQKLNYEDGITVVMISHDLNAALQYASHILHIGDRVFFGTKAAYLNEFPQAWQKGGEA